MFTNNFQLSGLVQKKNDLEDDKGKFQGSYCMLAGLGETFGVYIGKDIEGVQNINVGGFYQFEGSLKTKSILKAQSDDSKNISSIIGLNVSTVKKVENPIK